MRVAARPSKLVQNRVPNRIHDPSTKFRLRLGPFASAGYLPLSNVRNGSVYQSDYCGVRRQPACRHVAILLPGESIRTPDTVRARPSVDARFFRVVISTAELASQVGARQQHQSVKAQLRAKGVSIGRFAFGPLRLPRGQRGKRVLPACDKSGRIVEQPSTGLESKSLLSKSQSAITQGNGSY